MEKPIKLAISVYVLCSLAATAVATASSSSSTSMIDMNGLHIGIGVRCKSYTYAQFNEKGGRNGLITNVVGSKISFDSLMYRLSGELGYTFTRDRWIAGIKAQFRYDNARNVHTVDSSYQMYWGSHITTMLLAGTKINQSNAVYLATGYSSVWRKTALFSPIPVLSGVIAGIGWRHYFINNVFADLSYDYALYRSKFNSTNIRTGTTRLWFIENPKRTISGITATVNYFFNM